VRRQHSTCFRLFSDGVRSRELIDISCILNRSIVAGYALFIVGIMFSRE